MAKPFVTTGFLLLLLEVGTEFTYKKRLWRIENIYIDHSKEGSPKSYLCAPKVGKVFQTNKTMLRMFNQNTNVEIKEGYPDVDQTDLM